MVFGILLKVLQSLFVLHYFMIKWIDFAKMKNFIPKDAKDSFNFISDNFFGVSNLSQKW